MLRVSLLCDGRGWGLTSPSSGNYPLALSESRLLYLVGASIAPGVNPLYLALINPLPDSR